MNTKQLIAMWCGIGAFALVGVYEYWNILWRGVRTLLIPWLVVIVITGGLIITFKDKKPKDK